MRLLRSKSRIRIVVALVLWGMVDCGRSEEPHVTVPVIVPDIVRVLPHDENAFTQGLVYYDERLWESTGRYGQSSLRILDPESGEILDRRPVDRVFGEGVTISKDRVVQLTWKAGKAFVYSSKSLEKVGEFRYSGEGWGLTNHGDTFIMSNGSDTLFFRDPGFSVVRKLPVTHRGRPLKQLNELEFVRDKIYANVWYSDYIFEIDPSTGRVERMIDCRKAASRIMNRREEQVLNGIAYNSETETFYITGKDWPFLFEVRIP